MHTHETDRILATPEQLAILAGEIHLAVVKARPTGVTVGRLLGSKVATRKAIVAVLKALEVANTLDPRLTHCQALWTKLGMPLDCLDNLMMPDIPEGWTGLAIIPPISNEALFALCQKHFPSWKYYDLDDTKGEQDRPKRPYVLSHRGGVEPDAEHRNKNYDQCIREGLTFLTLKERICIELLHFAETCKHLDVDGFTITSSLAADGDAFDARWGSSYREFHVDGYGRGYARPTAGPRQAVYA